MLFLAPSLTAPTCRLDAVFTQLAVKGSDWQVQCGYGPLAVWTHTSRPSQRCILKEK